MLTYDDCPATCAKLSARVMAPSSSVRTGRLSVIFGIAMFPNLARRCGDVAEMTGTMLLINALGGGWTVADLPSNAQLSSNDASPTTHVNRLPLNVHARRAAAPIDRRDPME